MKSRKNLSRRIIKTGFGGGRVPDMLKRWRTLICDVDSFSKRTADIRGPANYLVAGLDSPNFSNNQNTS